MHIARKIIFIALLAQSYVSESHSMNFFKRQVGSVMGGASKVPHNITAVCDVARTATTGGKLQHQAWFCLQTEIYVKENQTFAQQWLDANCKKYTAAAYPKDWGGTAEAPGPAPFTADPGPNDAQGTPTIGTTMWAVKKTTISTSQLDPIIYNPLCKGLAEQLSFFQNERTCDMCKYSSEQNAISAAGGAVPPACETKKECMAIAAPPAYNPPPALSEATTD